MTAAGNGASHPLTTTHKDFPMDTTTAFTAALAELDTVLGGAAHEMRFNTSSWTLEHWIVGASGDDYLDLDAPYQRGSVWTVDQRRWLIRSVLLGIPVGSILVANTDNGDKPWRIVDGKQRIEAIRAFANDEFDVPASWARSGGDGTVRWSDLGVRTQRQFRNRQMPSVDFDSTYAFVLDDNGAFVRESGGGAAKRRQLDADEQNTYERCVYLLVNAGGTDHTAADLDVL